MRRSVAVRSKGQTDEALALLECENAGVGVVLSDHRMPGKTGTELLARVKVRWPHIVRIPDSRSYTALGGIGYAEEQLGNFLGGKFDHVVTVQEDRHRLPPHWSDMILARNRQVLV